MDKKEAQNKAIHAGAGKKGRSQSFYRDDKNSLLKGKWPEKPHEDNSTGRMTGQSHMNPNALKKYRGK